MTVTRKPRRVSFENRSFQHGTLQLELLAINVCYVTTARTLSDVYVYGIYVHIQIGGSVNLYESSIRSWNLLFKIQ